VEAFGLAVGDLVSIAQSAPGRLAAALPEARDRQAALAAAAIAVAVAGVAALVVAPLAAAPVREALGFGFAGVPRRLGEALAILAVNVRWLGAVAAPIVIVQSARFAGSDHRVLRPIADAMLAVAVLVNAAVVGAAVGAYGGRMIVAMLPHGPIELAAYALAIALYLRARSERLRLVPAVRLAAWALGLLVVAAFTETFLQP
jgi:hypothetical protein